MTFTVNDIIFFVYEEERHGFTVFAWENGEHKQSFFFNEWQAQQGAINWVRNGGDLV